MGTTLFALGRFMGDSKESTVSVPKFDKVPWLCEASLRNKPLVLSLPKRYPHASANFMTSSRMDMSWTNLLQGRDGLSKARRNQSDPLLAGNGQLCSTCREMRTAQLTTMMIPDDLKHSLSRRMKSLQPLKAQTASRCSPDDISTESIGCRLPILGPRAAVFRGLLSHCCRALRGTQLSPGPDRSPRARRRGSERPERSAFQTLQSKHPHQDSL